MKVYTQEELLDRDLGPVGTPERDKFEAELAEELHAYHVGEAIRQARKAKNLTQEELGERLGVKKAQISRLERGKSITLSTLSRVLKAMDIPTALDMQGIGRVALW